MKTKLPFKLRVTGCSSPLRCISLDAECADIKHGVGFAFDGEGAWCVDLADLEKIVTAAKKKLEETK